MIKYAIQPNDQRPSADRKAIKKMILQIETMIEKFALWWDNDDDSQLFCWNRDPESEDKPKELG